MTATEEEILQAVRELSGGEPVIEKGPQARSYWHGRIEGGYLDWLGSFVSSEDPSNVAASLLLHCLYPAMVITYGRGYTGEELLALVPQAKANLATKALGGMP